MDVRDEPESCVHCVHVCTGGENKVLSHHEFQQINSITCKNI